MYGFPIGSSSRSPRLLGWLLFTLVLLIGLTIFAPQQMQVVVYKTALVTLGAVLAYWIDRALFPYARPHTCQKQQSGPDLGPSDSDRYRSEMRFAAACIRRALIVLACVLGLTLGL